MSNYIVSKEFEISYLYENSNTNRWVGSNRPSDKQTAQKKQQTDQYEAN